MPRPRLTLRTLMVAVAVAALGGERLYRRVVVHRGLVRHYENGLYFDGRDRARMIRTALWLERPGRGPVGVDPASVGVSPSWVAYRRVASPDQVRAMAAMARRVVVSLERRMAYFADMRRKHERAARYPWLPVAPDPPEPKWSVQPEPPPPQ